MEIAHTIVDALEEKKGEDIVLLDIHDTAIFADYFVICTGTSDRMLNALGDFAAEQVKEKYHIHIRHEGKPEDGWLLIDFGDIVLHLFSPDRRRYYQLEDLWSEAKVLLHLQ